MDKEIVIYSYAKINLSIDVLGTLESGMHAVDMVMQQISLKDRVEIKAEKKGHGKGSITIKTNRPYLPVDSRNLAYRGAELIQERYPEKTDGYDIFIDMKKNIPVAAGLAGGSGNGAAVLHGLNTIFRLGMTMDQLCDLGKELGSDVPFCIMGQAKGNYVIPRAVRKSPLAGTCARAEGTGTELNPVKPLNKWLVIAKPAMGVSTKEVYQGIDSCHIEKRPDNDRLCQALTEGNFKAAKEEMINVLEAYTLKAYPKVRELKNLMENKLGAEKVLMSGSGPTVFALFNDIETAKKGCSLLRDRRYEAYWCKTTR